MAKGIRFIAQEYDLKSGKITREEVIQEKKVIYPKKIVQLGFCHVEQITLLQQRHNFLLCSRLIEINTRNKCPKCGRETKKLGKFKSLFHAVFTDHEMILQRRMCS